MIENYSDRGSTSSPDSRLNASSHPAQNAGQFNLRAQIGTGGGKAGGLFDLTYEELQLNQGARETGCQAIWNQAECAMPQGAIPAGDPGARRGEAFIGAVASKAAAPLCM